MGGDLTGDFAKLRAAVREFYTTPVESVPKLIAVDALELVHEVFVDEADPYGNPWQPTTQSLGGGGILKRTGNLMSRMRARANRSTLTVSSGARYGIYHQRGAILRKRKRRVLKAGPLLQVWLSDGNGGGAWWKQRRKRVTVKGAERGKLPARPFLPGASLPSGWDFRFTQTAMALFKKHFRSAGG